MTWLQARFLTLNKTISYDLTEINFLHINITLSSSSGDVLSRLFRNFDNSCLLIPEMLMFWTGKFATVSGDSQRHTAAKDFHLALRQNYGFCSNHENTVLRRLKCGKWQIFRVITEFDISCWRCGTWGIVLNHRPSQMVPSNKKCDLNQYRTHLPKSTLFSRDYRGPPLWAVDTIYKLLERGLCFDQPYP